MIQAIKIIKEAEIKIRKQYGDKGTCVGGMKLRYKGTVIAEQIAQGSLTNEYYYQEIKQRMIAELGASESDFSIDYGWMD